MKTKKFITSSLFLAIGFMLHYITPPFLFGMKPDFLLVMMLIAIFTADDYKMVICIGVVSGLLTALSTNFPGGQIPNMIDKFISSQIVYGMFKFLNAKLNRNIVMIIVSMLGTIISGVIFLGSASVIVGLPISFTKLIITVALPASIVNVIVAIVLFKIVNNALKYSAQN